MLHLAISTGISPAANIFARASCEQAPIGLLAKCEPMRLLCKRRVDYRHGVKTKIPHLVVWDFRFGDPYGNRTHDFSVRG